MGAAEGGRRSGLQLEVGHAVEEGGEGRPRRRVVPRALEQQLAHLAHQPRARHQRLARLRRARELVALVGRGDQLGRGQRGAAARAASLCVGN